MNEDFRALIEGMKQAEAKQSHDSALMKEYDAINARQVRSYSQPQQNPTQPEPPMVWQPDAKRIAIVTGKVVGLAATTYVGWKCVIIGIAAVVAVIEAHALLIGVSVLAIGALAACMGGPVSGSSSNGHSCGQSGTGGNCGGQNINININAPNGGNVTYNK